MGSEDLFLPACRSKAIDMYSDPEDWLTPEELRALERRREIEAEMAEIEHLITIRRDDTTEVEKLLRRLHYLEHRIDAIDKPRLRRIVVEQPQLELELRAA